MTVTFTFDLTLLYLVAVNVIGILVYVLLLKQRVRHQEKNIAAITGVITDYFRADGVEVQVDCVTRNKGKSFIAFVESEPMKRFRYSHIVEHSLRTHVRRLCRLELERIFWRFPIPGKDLAEAAMAAVEGPEEPRDEYIREGLEYMKKKNTYDIREGSWEEFENTVIKSGEKVKLGVETDK